MQHMEDYINIARRIFDGTRYDASDEDVKRLADNMVLLEKRGLGKLNKRLINSKGGIWATIAEHNFAVILASKLCSTIPINYEPDGLQRPPDFKVEIGGITYWIQMKGLSKLARENRQEKIIQKIEQAAKQIKVGKFFSCMLSDDFKKDCLTELIKFMNDTAASAPEEKSFLFTCKNNEKAEVKFWSPGRIALYELTLGYAGDLGVLEITELARDQIKGSLRKAVEAFNWEVDQRNINLIVMEADNKEDIDICDAIFGTEYDYDYFSGGMPMYSWCRKDDGVFKDSSFSKKIAGVIAIKRKRERDEGISALSPEEVVSRLSPQEKEISNNMTPEEIKKALEWKSPGPIAAYSLILYMNDRFKYLLETIKRLLSFDKIVYYNMRPSMGKGNFD
jgi:hypothetical protein